MTILFTGTKQEDGSKNRMIVDVLEKAGYIVKSRIPSLETSSKGKKNTFKRDLEICDFMIAEASAPSLSLGLEIATALAKNKHVLMLFDNNKSLEDLSEFARENSSRFAHVLVYSSETLSSQLPDTINSLKRELNYVLYVELPSRYGEVIEEIQRSTNKSKKDIIQDALKEYLPENQEDDLG